MEQHIPAAGTQDVLEIKKPFGIWILFAPLWFWLWSGIGDWLLALVFGIPYQMAEGDFSKLIFLYFLFLFPYSVKSDCFQPSVSLWESFLALFFGSPFYLALVQPHSSSAAFPSLPVLCFGGIWDNTNISIDIKKKNNPGPSAALTLWYCVSVVIFCFVLFLLRVRIEIWEMDLSLLGLGCL